MCDINNSIWYQSLVLPTVKWSNSSTSRKDGILSASTTLGESGPGSNSNECVLQISQNFKTGALSSECLISYPGYLLIECHIPLQRCCLRILLSQPTGQIEDLNFYQITRIRFITRSKKRLPFKDKYVCQRNKAINNGLCYWQNLCANNIHFVPS